MNTWQTTFTTDGLKACFDLIRSDIVDAEDAELEATRTRLRRFLQAHLAPREARQFLAFMHHDVDRPSLGPETVRLRDLRRRRRTLEADSRLVSAAAAETTALLEQLNQLRGEIARQSERLETLDRELTELRRDANAPS